MCFRKRNNRPISPGRADRVETVADVCRRFHGRSVERSRVLYRKLLEQQGYRKYPDKEACHVYSDADVKSDPTTAGPPVKSPRPAARRSPAYCYNCSGEGHFGHECAERRMFNRTYPTLPFTSSYDTQHDITSRAHRVRLQAEELKKAGLLVQAGDAPTPQSPRKKWKNAHFRSTPQRRNGQSRSTPQQPWKKAKNAHLLSAPIPQTPDPRTPKRRIAHTPKQPPRGIHTHWHEDTRTNTPQLAGKRKYKKQKRNASNGEPDFPRGFRKNPHDEGARFRTPPHRGRKSPGALFGSEKSKKKNKEEEWERKENLFMIKQRKRRR
ncbi:hypothetical protein AMELA_G00275750 [Ameiurus melas]|uniref:Zinc finger CCHC domain-containing protein 7 n=1 Tax=Ameiurus melas TaxID=219545 RepID=A0A7J5ZPE1_AMEME|nr:hypothetical protein AMELA_G00275750 [Ameiurus melas]